MSKLATLPNMEESVVPFPMDAAKCTRPKAVVSPAKSDMRSLNVRDMKDARNNNRVSLNILLEVQRRCESGEEHHMC